jgi:zinc/manganese transport system substrate-binding protein
MENARMTHSITRRLLLAGLALAPRAAFANAPLPVVASFSILADFVRQIAGDRVKLVTLVGPEADVHAFEPSPAHARQLAEAAVLVSNGLGLETWLPRLARAAKFSGRAILAAQMVQRRKAGGAIDPHAWQDVGNAKLYVGMIRDGLAAADPDGGDAYRAAAAAYLLKLTKLDAEIRAALAPIPRFRRIIVTTHDAFGYFGAAYGVDFLAPLGLSTEAEPSPRQIAALVQQIRARHARGLFLEKFSNGTLLEQIARETDVRIGGEVYSDALSNADGPAATYEAMMRHNLSEFVKALA